MFTLRMVKHGAWPFFLCTVSSFLALYIIYLTMMGTTKDMDKCIELSSYVMSEIKYSIQFNITAYSRYYDDIISCNGL